MQKRYAFRLIISRLLVLLCTVLVGAAGYFVASGNPAVFSHSTLPLKNSGRTLTFDERVAYQRLIEEVYWRHRIWPRENAKAKPSLDEVMPAPQIETKVADYLRKSQVLEDYWQRPITAEQLQAEMDRMAKQTRQPDVLREFLKH
jgi:hypothetical protein